MYHYQQSPHKQSNERTISTLLCLIFQVVLINIINGEVHFCLKFSSVNSSQSTVYAAAIPTLFEEISKEIQNDIKRSPLAKTGSFNYSHFHLYISHSAVTFDSHLSNGSVTLDDPIIRFFTHVSEEFELFNLTFPTVYINGSYDMDGYIGANRLFDIYGQGDFYLHPLNFSVAVVSSLKINSSSLCVPITVKVYLQDFKSHFEGYMNGDEDLEPMMNDVTQYIVPDALRIIFREDADFADPYIQAIIDSILNRSYSAELSRLLYVLSSDRNQLSLFPGSYNKFHKLWL